MMHLWKTGGFRDPIVPTTEPALGQQERCQIACGVVAIVKKDCAPV